MERERGNDIYWYFFVRKRGTAHSILGLQPSWMELETNNWPVVTQKYCLHKHKPEMILWSESEHDGYSIKLTSGRTLYKWPMMERILNSQTWLQKERKYHIDC